MRETDRALSMASGAGDLGRVRSIIEQWGGNANASGALIRALVNNRLPRHAETAEYLLKEGGADPNLPEPMSGRTPLYVASGMGNLEMVELLLSYGAQVDSAVENAGRTPLMVACQMRHASVVRCLLEHGANPFLSKRVDGSTPFTMAISGFGVSRFGTSNAIEIAELLLERADMLGGDEAVIAMVTKKQHCGSNALHLACGTVCGTGSSDLVRKLLYRGEENNKTKRLLPTALYVRDGRGRTPLFIACEQNNLWMVEAILECSTTPGASTNPDIPDNTGTTPLMVAVKSSSKPIVELLLSNGANPFFVRTSDGATPVHLAAQNSFHPFGPNTMEALLSQSQEGCDDVDIVRKVNAEMKSNGHTPLSLAVAAHDRGKEVQQMLLDRGANPFLAANNGTSPLEVAAATCRKQDLDLVRRVLAAGVPYLLSKGRA